MAKSQDKQKKEVKKPAAVKEDKKPQQNSKKGKEAFVAKTGSWKDQKNGSCVVLDCTCENEFQSRTYGPNKRVHNIGGKTSAKKATCTSCGAKK